MNITTSEEPVVITDPVVAPQISTVEVTPDLARLWLGFNTKNRNVSPSKLAQYTRAMKRGEWVFNGDPIRFAKDGRLIDGQHRLLASIDANHTFTAVIISGLNESSQETIDQGAPRSLANVLTFRGYSDTTTLAAIARIGARFVEGGWVNAFNQKSNASQMVTNGQAVEFIEKTPRILELTGHQNRNYLLPRTLVVFLRWAFEQIDPDDAEMFFEKFKSGAGLEADDPILRLREVLISDKSSKSSKMNSRYKVALTTVAWNKFRAGSSVKQLRWRQGGAAREPFPIPDGLEDAFPVGPPSPEPHVVAGDASKVIREPAE